MEPPEIDSLLQFHIDEFKSCLSHFDAVAQVSFFYIAVQHLDLAKLTLALVRDGSFDSQKTQVIIDGLKRIDFESVSENTVEEVAINVLKALRKLAQESGTPK